MFDLSYSFLDVFGFSKVMERLDLMVVALTLDDAPRCSSVELLACIGAVASLWLVALVYDKEDTFNGL